MSNFSIPSKFSLIPSQFRLNYLCQQLAIRTNPKKIIKEYIAYLALYLKPYPPNQVRIVIFAQGRTGSTLLESLLGSSNQIQENGELLAQVNSPFQGKITSPYRYICGLSKLTKKNFVFHLKPYHLTEEQKIDPTIFLNQLATKGWKIIHLHRENSIMHVISNVIALKRKNFHKLNDKEEDLQIEVDLNYFVSMVNKRLKYNQLEKEYLKSLDHIELIYEEDLMHSQTHQRTADKVFEYIKLPRVKVSTNLRKINKKSLRDIVKNYAELEDCIIKNGWSHFLTEIESGVK